MSRRIDRVNELIKQQLLELFHFDFPDEIISINFITTAPDLSESKIFISIASGHKSIYDQIISKSNKYWKDLSKIMHIRRLPRLIFCIDEMQSEIEKIEELIERSNLKD